MKTSFLAVVIAPVPSLDIQVILILILIDVQYLQKAVFRFEKGLNHQNHSPSASHHLVKKIPFQAKFLILSPPPPNEGWGISLVGWGIPTHPLLPFGKPCNIGHFYLLFLGNIIFFLIPTLIFDKKQSMPRSNII